MIQGEKLLVYRARMHTTGGREHGSSRSSDGRLEVRFATPGTSVTRTNPEQLLAAGWSACFGGALDIAACRRKVDLPSDLAIDAEVDRHYGADGYFLRARLVVSLPGLAPE